MEEEIDLRPYIEAVLRNWKWVIGAAILAALVALAITFLIPPTYQATALVAVTESRQVIQFDPRITVSDDDLPFEAYPDLAMSDEIMVALLDEVGANTPDIANIRVLRSILSVEAGSDPSLLIMSTKYGDPEVATAIVNEWAELFVVKANDVFGSQGGDQLLFFKDQLENSATELQLSEESLVDFQESNRSLILENELLALQQTQADHLVKRRQIQLLIQDASVLQEQLELAENDSELATADQLATILLQLRAFSGVPAAEASVPWQLQVSVGDLARATSEEQVNFLSGLQETLTRQAEEIDARLVELEPLIFAVQTEKQRADAEETRLARNIEVAENAYTALANKVQEEEITSQDKNSGVRLASRSAVPSAPESSNRWLFMVLAAVFGALVAVVVIVIKTGLSETQPAP